MANCRSSALAASRRPRGRSMSQFAVPLFFLGLLLNEVGMGKHADFMGFEWNFKWFQGDVNRNLMGFNG